MAYLETGHLPDKPKPLNEKIENVNIRANKEEGGYVEYSEEYIKLYYIREAVEGLKKDIENHNPQKKIIHKSLVRNFVTKWFGELK